MNKEIFVKLLAQRQFKAVRSILDVMNEVDIASLLSDLNDKELALAFRLIPKDKAAEVFWQFCDSKFNLHITAICNLLRILQRLFCIWK